MAYFFKKCLLANMSPYAFNRISLDPKTKIVYMYIYCDFVYYQIDFYCKCT